MPSLSISLPVYNFAAFLPETLTSILSQDGVKDVDVVVVDGASTDDTGEVVARIAAAHHNLRYVRLPVKGGIDRDMELAVEHATGDYVWLFSGDDIMEPGALQIISNRIKSLPDVILCRHLEQTTSGTRIEYPVLSEDGDRRFELTSDLARNEYARLAKTTEAFFSFMSSLVVKRASWHTVASDERFEGTCWAHAARLLRVMKNGMVLDYVHQPLLFRRPDNDSFLKTGLVNRFAIAIDGYNLIGDTLFGSKSDFARSIRRVLFNEFPPWHLAFGKFAVALAPDREDHKTLKRLLRKVYSDFNVQTAIARVKYASITPEDFYKWNPRESQKMESLHNRLFKPRRIALPFS